MKNLQLFTLMFFATSSYAIAQNSIYHNDWIDFNKNGKKDIFEDPSQPVDARVKNLLSQMTVDEKTCQTATLYGYGRVLKDELPTSDWRKEIWKDGIANIDEELNGLAYHPKAITKYSYPFSRHADAINNIQKWFIEQTRLGIPADFTNEGIHGLNHDRATPLPAPIAMSSTWDKTLLRHAGDIIGREAKVLGYTNVYAPILDLARDPRWGRVVETYGEDPFLVAELGKQMVLGIQERGIGSTLKHFAVYSVPKGGRDGDARTDPHVAPRELHELYLYPFRRIIKEVNIIGIMSSYNDWDGMPITGSYYFLTELLRHRYGFTGYVVSDSEAVEFLYTKYHVAKSVKDAVKQAFEAGLNVRTNFTPPQDFIIPLRELINSGEISKELLDSRVSDVLRVKFKLGLFDHPYVIDTKEADDVVYNQDALEFTKQASREAIVLLKNAHNLLPLNRKEIKKILVTGPLATETNHAISRYGPSNVHVVSMLDGIRKVAGEKIEVTYERGCNVVDKNWPESEILPEPLDKDELVDINAAVNEAKKSDIIVAVLGETEKMVGESCSTTSLNLAGRQLQLLQALHATGKPVVLVLINGRPLTINWANKYVPSILETWFPGAQGGTALAETLFGDYNPGGKLTVTFPKSVGQVEYNFPFKKASQAGQAAEGPNGGGKTLITGSLYPFGHGLSYTMFHYDSLKVDAINFHNRGDIRVTFDVKNTGTVVGDEIVQLYLKHMTSSVTTYDSQLRGFERVNLKPSQVKKVTFILHSQDLSLLDKDMNWIVEPGEYKIMIGASSEDIRLSENFMIKK